MVKKNIAPETDRLKALFLQHCALRNFSPLTIRQLEQGIRVFVQFLQGRDLGDIRRVRRRDFEAYKEFLAAYVSPHGRTLTNNTIRERLFLVQRWFAFLRKRGHLKEDAIAEVQVPRFRRRLPKGVLRPDEIRRVMEQPKLESVIGYRDRTIMEVLYATGARANEVAHMRAPDVDLEKKVIRIRQGKGHRDRLVPLTTTSCRFLERYLRDIRPELAQCLRPAGNNWKLMAGQGGDLLFLSIYGGPLKASWLGCMMKRYLFLARIEKKISPVHGFRHSVATHLIGNGMDVRYVQTLLGHTNINSTQIYTHIERETLKREIARHHPRALTARMLVTFKEAVNADHR